ncbi:MAG: hypothetical protein M3Q07_13130, partial [Pseudobdellovibrionaceae bacterium]|nr:hypothetical protein [Pseudobdellovibrionaceae bacterium]
FCNAHDQGSLPRPLAVVCNPLLQTDYEGPAFIFHAAFYDTLSSRRQLLPKGRLSRPTAFSSPGLNFMTQR